MKNGIKLLAVLAASAAILALTANKDCAQDIDLGDLTDKIHCRCKDGGCYGGNLISFRALCAVSDDEGYDCSSNDSNCNGDTDAD